MNQPPPLGNEDRQAIIDNEHLRLLSIFHYVVGAIHIACASFLILHLVVLSLAASDPEMLKAPQEGSTQMPAEIIRIIQVFVGVIMLLGWTFGGLTIFAGKCIAKRQKRMFTLVMAGINCVAFPFGTALGVFTIVVLSRDSVRRQYSG